MAFNRDITLTREEAIARSKINKNGQYFNTDRIISFLANYLNTHKDVTYVGNIIDYDTSLKDDWTINRIENTIKISKVGHDGLYSDKAKIVGFTKNSIKGNCIEVDGTLYECKEPNFLAELQLFILATN